MNVPRAILTGAFVWVLVLTSFIVVSMLPGIKDSLNKQGIIVGLLLIPYALTGAYLYYKNGNKANGWKVGAVMTATALLGDALVTVPFVEMPNGGSYASFFTSPVLWLLVAVNISTVFFYWRKKVAA